MKLLIVEDEPNTGDYIRRGLTQAGFTVHVSKDGLVGLNRALDEHYDLVVLDIMLPSLDGWEVLRRLRKTRKTPVLMLTARDAVRDRVRGLDGGADDYVVKPFDLPELFARLRALIRRSANKSTNLIEIREVTLDTAARQVTRGGAAVELTAREYALLEYLMRRAGRIVTRTMLLEQVWDLHFDPQTNVVDSQISRLRAKIDRDFDIPLLHTLRGIGYRLGDEI